MIRKKEKFGNRFGVVMAMAGSAVGLGNIWRFPYMVGQYGGAAFILLYVVASFILALPIFFSESIIGRRSGLAPLGAMQKLAPGTSWIWAGRLCLLAPLLILGYYNVVGGWSLEYFVKSLTFDFTRQAPQQVTGFFSQFISSVWGPIAAHTLFLGITASILMGGVSKGIEKFSNLTMPILFVLVAIIAGYSFSLPGARAGVDYLFKPDFSRVTPETVAAAMGQAFFSLSLGVGTILTYSSYVRKDENLLVSGLGTCIADLFFALLAGMAIMPAVFAAGLTPEAGPGLVFETLPYIFNQLGVNAPWLVGVVAALFFLSVLVAAVTSSISMMEVGVSHLVSNRGFSRKKATLAISGVLWLLSVPCSLSFGPLAHFKFFGLTVFDFLDRFCSVCLMPLGGLLFTLFVGWQMSKAHVYDEFTNGGTCNTRIFDVLYFLIRYLAPVGIVVIFLSSIFL